MLCRLCNFGTRRELHIRIQRLSSIFTYLTDIYILTYLQKNKPMEKHLETTQRIFCFLDLRFRKTSRNVIKVRRVNVSFKKILRENNTSLGSLDRVRRTKVIVCTSDKSRKYISTQVGIYHNALKRATVGESCHNQLSVDTNNGFCSKGGTEAGDSYPQHRTAVPKSDFDYQLIPLSTDKWKRGPRKAILLNPLTCYQL